jgi:hypothetical protein
MKFIITEEEKKHILGLYEQVSGSTIERRELDPESVNGEFTLHLWVPENLVRVNDEDIAGILEYGIDELAGEYYVEVTKKIKSPSIKGYWYINFDVRAKHKDTMKQSKWLYDFSNKVRQKIIETYKMRNINIQINEPKYVWGEYFESEPTNSPDKCIGVSYKVDYNSPTT